MTTPAELDKYIFDPANPSAFRAYDLLLKIIRDGDNIVYMDPFFYAAFFEKEIFTPDTVKDLWDKPDDFDELNAIEKSQVYIDNYSLEEFQSLLIQRVGEVKTHFLLTLFRDFLAAADLGDIFDLSSMSTIFSHKLISENAQAVWQFFSSEELKESTNSLFAIDLPDIYAQKRLLTFALTENIGLLYELEIPQTSLWITTLDEYQKAITEHGELPLNFRPILLQDIRHLPLLFDFVRRDLASSKEPLLAEPREIPSLASVSIRNYFSIEAVDLTELSDVKEAYFIGENGDGKTILLQAIALAMRGYQSEGVVIDFVKQNTRKELRLTATTSDGAVFQYEDSKAQEEGYTDIFAYGVSRFRNDTDKKDTEGYLSLFSHEQYLESPVSWLQHLDHKAAKNEVSPVSLEEAKELLREVLERNVEIEVGTEEVVFSERGTRLAFEQLSDGYKSVIVWVCDLVMRLSKLQPHVKTLADFRGVVLIDEVGAFLHPRWQVKIVQKLRKWFRGLQFLMTTHSPMMLLGASRDAVIYRVYKEEGVTKVSAPIQNEDLADRMANVLITSPFLFRLDTARSAAFDEKQDSLDTSDDYLSSEIHKAISARLKERLHVDEGELLGWIKQELLAYESGHDQD